MLRKIFSRSKHRESESAPAELVSTGDMGEVEGLAVRWTMVAGKRNVVCWARAATLEKLEGNPDLAKSDYLTAFQKHRDTLEEVAKAIFKRGKLDGNAIIIRHENV